MHAELREINHVLSIESPLEAFCNRIAERLVVEHIDDKIVLCLSGILPLTLVAGPVPVFFYKIEVYDIRMGFVSLCHHLFDGIGLHPVV